MSEMDVTDNENDCSNDLCECDLVMRGGKMKIMLTLC